MNIHTIDEIIAQDEELAPVPIYQKDGDPYLGPDGEPCTISVYGNESKAGRKVKKSEWRKMVKRHGTPEAEEIDDQRLDKAVTMVGAWSGWESAPGVLAECNAANIRALLKAEHILAQVEAGVQKHAAFLRASKAS